MTKHEHPPFRMVIEGGKMVPATAYDAERLDTYRRGTEVRVTLTEEKDRPMVRKWWAILGRAIKECKTPWQNKEQASEAIKLALGIVNLSKTVGGAWLQYPKSLTELTDPEVTEAVERMIDVIYHVTGVDASVWRKHVENIRDNEPADVPSVSGGSDGPPEPPSTQAVAASPIEPAEAADLTTDGSIEAPADPDALPSVIPSDEDRAWLKLVAKMLWAATGVGEQDVLKRQMAGIREGHTPVTINDTARAKANSINAKCKLVCFGEASAADVLPLIAGIAGCDVKDIA